MRLCGCKLLVSNSGISYQATLPGVSSHRKAVHKAVRLILKPGLKFVKSSK